MAKKQTKRLMTMAMAATLAMSTMPMTAYAAEGTPAPAGLGSGLKPTVTNPAISKAPAGLTQTTPDTGSDSGTESTPSTPAVKPPAGIIGGGSNLSGDIEKAPEGLTPPAQTEEDKSEQNSDTESSVKRPSAVSSILKKYNINMEEKLKNIDTERLKQFKRSEEIINAAKEAKFRDLLDKGVIQEAPAEIIESAKALGAVPEEESDALLAFLEAVKVLPTMEEIEANADNEEYMQAFLETARPLVKAYYALTPYDRTEVPASIVDVLLLAEASMQNAVVYDWNEVTQTLTLENYESTETIKLPAGWKIVANGVNKIHAESGNAIECEGALTIEGSGSLELSGNHGIKATTVAIQDIKVNFDAASAGIYVTNTAGDTGVTLKNVTGHIEGDYAGIYVFGDKEGSNAAVLIEDCNLDVESKATSGTSRATKSGIVIYITKAMLVESAITVKDSVLNASGPDAGLTINNYKGAAENSASSYINIENSTVSAVSVNGTWGGIFASVLSHNADADSIITVKDSTVYVESPSCGLLTSSQKGESKIVLDNSVLGVSAKTPCSTKGGASEVAVTEINNGSTYIQMTPDATVLGELDVNDGKTIVAEKGQISYDFGENYYVIPQESEVTETYSNGKVNEYTFYRGEGGIGGGATYGKTTVWGYDVDIEINSPEELILFSEIANGEKAVADIEDEKLRHMYEGSGAVIDEETGKVTSFAGVEVALGQDIDMDGYNWYHRDASGTVISDHRINNLNAIFNGSGYTIENMSYVDEYAEATEVVPLAFILNNTGDLKNIHIDGITVDTEAPARFAGLADAFVWSQNAYAEGCTVENIEVNADAQLSFGGMFFKAFDIDYIADCHVDNFTVNAHGVLDGAVSGRCGGFIASGGEGNKKGVDFIGCTVTDFTLNAESTGKYVGGFIGGASIGGKYKDCVVDGFVLDADGYFAGAVGGFVGFTSGGRGHGGVNFTDCIVKDLDVTTDDKISAGAGGFIGNCYGNDVHRFTNCTAEGSIEGDAYAGGFVGWLYGRSATCAAEFTDCEAAVDILENDYYAGGFVGNHNPAKDKLIAVTYDNCTATGDVFGVECEGIILDNDADSVDGITGGTYNYDPEDDPNNNVAEGYRALDNGDGTWTVFPDNGQEVLKVAFNRLTDDAKEYENWRTVEVFQNVDFKEEAYDNEKEHRGEVYDVDPYRFEKYLDELNDEAKLEGYTFTFWTGEPYGDELVLDEDTEVLTDMVVYAAYTKAVDDSEDDDDDDDDDDRRPGGGKKPGKPKTDISDGDVPLGEMPEFVIDDEDVPMAAPETEAEDKGEVLGAEEEAPLADVPGTGDQNHVAGFGAMAIAALAGMFGLRKKENN